MINTSAGGGRGGGGEESQSPKGPGGSRCRHSLLRKEGGAGRRRRGHRPHEGRQLRRSAEGTARKYGLCVHTRVRGRGQREATGTRACLLFRRHHQRSSINPAGADFWLQRGWAQQTYFLNDFFQFGSWLLGVSERWVTSDPLRTAPFYFISQPE